VPSRDAARTRARILVAATDIFSHRAYGQAGIREVAKQADVNSALVMRYFKSKEELFREALGSILSAERLQVTGGPNFGSSLARRLLDEESGPNPLPMLVVAAADPIARDVALSMVQSHIIDPLVGSLDARDSEGRAARILAVCAGFFTWRTLLPLPPMTGQLDPKTRTWLENALQSAYDS
jgi:AcrR family transcriptional regulator